MLSLSVVTSSGCACFHHPVAQRVAGNRCYVKTSLAKLSELFLCSTKPSTYMCGYARVNPSAEKVWQNSEAGASGSWGAQLNIRESPVHSTCERKEQGGWCTCVSYDILDA